MQSNEAKNEERKSFFQKHRNALIAVGAMLVLALGCCLGALIFGGGREGAAPEDVIEEPVEVAEEEREPTDTSIDTDTRGEAEVAEETQTPEPTEAPETQPTSPPLAPSYAEIVAAAEGMTDAQWKAYESEQEGKRIEQWTGWVADVKQKTFGGYELWVDMDPPEALLSVQDVQFDIAEDRALEVSKDEKVMFSGVIKRVARPLGSVMVTLEEATWEIAE
ncbi:MAG: hypothetical protein ACOC6F_02340 [bacterium]